jgi:hypothetical protein
MSDYNAQEKMLHIKALDSEASVQLSEWTHCWYVSARIDVGGSGTLEGITEHRSLLSAAVGAFFDKLTSLPVDRFLVTNHQGQRREWRWNGSAFAECTRALPEDSE